MAGAPMVAEGTDRELLQRFAETGEQGAFAALVERHGSLVLGVCRRVLNNAEDAEDAFQATFLVLARKADSPGWQDSIGNWLYGVAYRVAMKTRTRRMRQRHRELEYQPERNDGPTPADQITWGELRCVLDAELQRLPAKYRAPLLLCYLEGKTRDEAAVQLGWSPGSVKGRLERGRELLRIRLAGRGLTVSAVLCASLLPQSADAAVPVSLAANTLQAATGFVGGTAGVIAPNVLSLAQGVIQAMVFTKIKIMGVLMVGVSLLTLGAVGTYLAAYDDNGREGGVPAIVKSIDTQKGTITVQTFAGENLAEKATTFNLAGKDVRVTVNERSVAQLADLSAGTRVRLQLSAEDDVVAINAVAPTMRVRVKSVDAANKTVTIFVGERGETKEVKVAAEVRLPANVQPGMPAEMVLSLDRSTVVALNPASERRPDGERQTDGDRRAIAERIAGRGLRGVAVNVAADKGTIEVLEGGEENPKFTTYQVAKDVQFLQNERPTTDIKLENIPRAARLTFRLAEDGKTITHLSVLAPTVGGVLAEVDGKAGTFTLRTERERKTFKLAPNALIRMGDRKVEAAELKIGMRVVLHLSMDGSQVQTMNAYGGAVDIRRDAPREGERPAERRDGQPREGGVRDGDLKRPIEGVAPKRDGE